jgi:hypothetical protein
MLAGCRRAAEAAGDTGERPRASASASAVLPSAGGVGCEIAEPLDDPFGSFAGARSRRRRPRMIMWCPQQSRTTYSPPGQRWSSLFLQVSRGTWKSPSRFAIPTVPPPPTRSAPRAGCGGLPSASGQPSRHSTMPGQHRLPNHEFRPFHVEHRRCEGDLNSGGFTWNVAAAGVDLRRFGCRPSTSSPNPGPQPRATRTMGAWRGSRAGADTERAEGPPCQ